MLVWVLLLALSTRVEAQPTPGEPPSMAQLDSLRQRLRASTADTNRVNQLLLLGRFYVARSAEGNGKADTMLLLARQAQALSQALHYPKGQGLGYLLSAQVWMQQEAGMQRGKECARQAVRLFTRIGNVRLTAEAYWELSNSLAHRMEDIPEQIACFTTCIALYRQIGDVRAQADMLSERSSSYGLLGKDEAALADLQAALRLYRASGQARLMTVYSRLGRLYFRREDYKNALSYGLLAIKTVETLGDSSIMAAEAYNQVGGVYFKLGYQAKGLGYYQKALTIAQHKPYDETVVAVVSNVVTALEKTGQPAAALRILTKFTTQYPPEDEIRKLLTALQLLGLHTALKQYALAQHNYNQLQAVLKPLPEGDVRFGFAYKRAIAFLLATRQYEPARRWLVQQERYYQRQKNSSQDIGQNQLDWFRLDSALGNYPAAIRHYQRHIAIKDSLFNESKSKEISRLDVQYQSQRKDQEITLQKQNIQLLNKRKLLQDKELQRVQLLRNGAAAGSVLLLLLLGISYNRYQLKQRSNQLLETKQAEINAQNQSLAKVLAEKGVLLEEKEWMLKEIHHRVKNNLEVIQSLLSLQGDFLHDPSALDAMRESQNRVHAMALIHQKLYQSDSLARVNMQEYIRDIADYLVQSFDREASVRGQFDVAPVELDVALATPLGLIINEALTNSLKYAFPQQRPGIIAIALTRSAAPQRYQLIIADNGIGMSGGFYEEQVHTLGITMIKGLSRQIDAHLTVMQDNGVQITLEFEVASKG